MVYPDENRSFSINSLFVAECQGTFMSKDVREGQLFSEDVNTVIIRNVSQNRYFMKRDHKKYCT